MSAKLPDLCLDPVCGSGTMAVACARQGRRYIAIDREPAAIEITCERLTPIMMTMTRVIDFKRDQHIFIKDPHEWDSDWNFVVLGDSLEVLRSMPDGIVTLIYADPPFNANREFRNEDGVGFSDIWRWDDEAEARLHDIEQLDVSTGRYLNGRTEQARLNARKALLLQIELCRIQGQNNMASYLTWMMLLLTECRRVLK